MDRHQDYFAQEPAAYDQDSSLTSYAHDDSVYRTTFE